MNTDEYEKMTAMTPSDELEDAVGNLLAEVKRLQAYKEFADAVDEWSHGASHIHFLAEQVNHIRSTSQYDDDAMNHGCTSYYNGPNSASQVSDKEYKDLLAEVKRLRKELAYNSKVYHEMCEEGIMAWNNAECRLAGEEEMFGEVD